MRAALLLCLAMCIPSIALAGDYERLGRLEKEAVDLALRREGMTLDPDPDGKIVGRIRVVNLEVFLDGDGSLTWFNRFHFTTDAEIVTREVLLRPGTIWNQALVDETRRNLIDPFLSNVVVLLPLVSEQPGQVDLIVVTRDVWSLRLNSNFEVQGDALTRLAFSLSENNIFGWRKKLIFAFAMDQGQLEIGPTYKDDNIVGSRWLMSSTVRALFSRESQDAEGSWSQAVLAYPLYSLASHWGVSLGVSHFDGPLRRFRGNDLYVYDRKDVPGDDDIPWVFQKRKLSIDASVVRSFGRDVKQNVSGGHELSQVAYRVPEGLMADPDAVQSFRDHVLPRSEMISALFLQYQVYTPRYAGFRDLDGFDLREDLRLGPYFGVKASAASTALGSDADFVRLSGAGSFAFGFGSDGYARVATEWSGRFQDHILIDQYALGDVYAASPKLGRMLRVVAEVSLDGLIHETNNGRLGLGGDSGLRGYDINQFVGDTRFLGHLELRSMPLEIAFLRFGGLFFWDAGGAWNRDERGFAESLHSDVGIGLRTLIPQIDPFVVRADVAFPTQGPNAGMPRVSLGVRQVF